MPVLPHLSRRAADAIHAIASQDTRVLDSRQLLHHARDLFKRIPLPTLIQKRNNNSNVCRAGYIAGCYQFGGAAPGAVAGITLGAIAGFLLVLWLLWVLSNGTSFIRTSNLQEEEVVVRHRHSRSPGRSRRSHRSTYQAEMRHSSPRRERVVRQERIVRDVPQHSRPDSSRVRETIIVDEARPERRVDGDDIVEVIEEHSSVAGAPPPRRKNRRSSGYR
ncbi:uncharacterized protein LTR77_006177 [Saxophila tyrrhenica]|uniref:Uncharacterized protein n=1 Tax=Saxophila tyrrhenica TaxID=1690608 RepID=A0AAV9P7L0_9PEZI|nr:hypothetical protein LTR77_006177 [Saxophila tyrrhenica]